MGLHTRSDREKRRRKYTEQFIKTAENKNRKALKRQKKLDKRKNRTAKGVILKNITPFLT